MSEQHNVKVRNIFLVYLYSMLTLGLYTIYWMVSTKREINKHGGTIPSTFLALIPIVGLYWSYKYCDCFASKIKKNDNGIIYFMAWIFFPPVIPMIVQNGLNEFSRKNISLTKKNVPHKFEMDKLSA